MSDFTSPQIIQYPNSTDTEAFGADANGNVAVDNYAVSNAGLIYENGLFVALSPTATRSEVYAISDTGLAVGEVNNAAVTYQVGGSLTALNLASLNPTAGQTSEATGVSENGKNIVGYYNNGSAYFSDIGGTFSTVVVPGSSVTSSTANAVNDSGEIVGTFVSGGADAAFIVQNGAYTEFEVPNAFTTALGVNNSGTVVGTYTDATHIGSYTRDAIGNLTYINAPHATDTYAQAINDAGQVAGYYFDSTTGQDHGFVTYNGATIQVDIAGDTNTQIFSINNQGEITGIATNSSGNTVAFAEKPLPEVKLTSAGATGPDKSSFTITGTAFSSGQAPEVGQTVTILDNNQAIGTTTVQKDGTFSDTLALPNIGNNAITASITADGVTGTSSAVNYNLFQAVRDLDGVSQEVERLYYSILNRAADSPSLTIDDSLLTKHPGKLTAVATGLVKSKEFRTDFGHLNDSQFVQQIFEAATGTAIDSTTLQHDVRALQHGESRGALAVSFAQSDVAVAHIGVKMV